MFFPLEKLLETQRDKIFNIIHGELLRKTWAKLIPVNLFNGGSKLKRTETPGGLPGSLIVYTSIFITSLTASNYLAAKISLLGKIGGLEILVPAGVVAYALTFTATDLISEIYGKKTANLVVRIGFLTQLIILFYSWTAVKLPIAPFQSSEAGVFEKLVASPPNIVIASLTAYIVSQHHDVWAFHKWREKTGGKYLWLRNNASTLVSQLIDTTIFISLAFSVIPSIIGGVSVSLSLIPNLILGQYIVKVLIALLDTPLVYLGVMLERGRA